MTNEQMNIICDFNDLLLRQIDKINKKGDISPDELMRMDKAVDIVKDIFVICAMEEYGQDPEEEMYSSMGYYGRNSRGFYERPMYAPPMTRYSGGRDSMGRYSSRGYSRDGSKAHEKLRNDLEMKLANATDETERQIIMKCLSAINE